MIAVSAVLAAALAAGAAPGAFDALAPMDTVMRRLAGPAGFRSGDFDLLVNYRAPVPKAPAAVTGLLRNPSSADSLAPALRRDLRETAAGGIVRAEPLWKWLDAAPPAPSGERSPAVRARNAEAFLKQYLDPLAPSALSFLLRETPDLFRHRADDTLFNPIEREIERLRGGAITDSVMRLAERLPMEKLAEAARDLDAVLHEILEEVRERGIPAATESLRALKKAGIPVAVGTPGDDVHRLDRGIVFDPGGNDRYEFPGSPRPGSWLLVIDLEGDDTYVAGDTSGAAAAFLSAQILADLKGNDRYLGGDFAFGSALMGFARLFDAEGDDVYEGRSASLGFAFRGIGILQDRAGNDSYSSAFLSQAASSSFGLAVLLDEDGHDQYVSRPVFVDDLRYRDRFLSLSQGFSTGMAPRHGGGIAALWDRAGNDLYSADIFGQGAGYWFAWGLVMDDAGNDKFLAHQYAQGAGVHFAAGMLLDGAGDDVRISKGVSQGCGHDGAFGLLADASGNDRNLATDMSAGAGSANGMGILLDLAGDDAYVMGNPAMTLGHGDMRRDRGSMGFFLDRGGKDSYPGSFGDGSAWRVYDGKKRGNGYGLDGE